MSRHVMSVVDLMHKMAKIKEQFPRSANIRADTQQQDREAEEETAYFHLQLNNLEITLRNVQPDAEWRLKRACSHSKSETEPTIGTQEWEQADKQRMPPPNPRGTMETTDDTLHRQHRIKPEGLAEGTRSLLQTI
jgi:hypothetical protein